MDRKLSVTTLNPLESEFQFIYVEFLVSTMLPDRPVLHDGSEGEGEHGAHDRGHEHAHGAPGSWPAGSASPNDRTTAPPCF